MRDILARTPPELRPLAEIAFDLWWTWQPEGPELFRDVDPDRWEACGRNPVKLLRFVAPSRLATVCADATFLERVAAFHAKWKRERDKPFERTDVATPDRPLAFVCAEFGLDAALPIYSGGLGGLAGDLLKEASDSGVPTVGVGLFYRRGYFRQRLDRSGWQHEYWTAVDPEELPLVPELDAEGAPRIVHVDLRGRAVEARIWRVDVGRTRLYLLDTDVPTNDPTSRWITSTLYVTDRAMRLMQYAILAIGGVRALRQLGIDPTLFHLNEGHASLVALELLREERARRVPPERALEAVRSRIVFTTHTPVAAGNEHYSPAEVAAVLAREVDLDDPRIFELARGRPG
jgi:starch phosphorylase